MKEGMENINQVEVSRGQRAPSDACCSEMSIDRVEILVRGKPLTVPAAQVGDRTVMVTGTWIKVASIHEEKILGNEAVKDPVVFIKHLKQQRLQADIFTFAQTIPETIPKYDYPFEWDNAAAVPITTYADWLAKQAATDVRQNVKKAAKRGVVVKSVEFDDFFINGVVELYNESPVRQGKRFWHYGKDFNTVKRETAHRLDKSEFIGAYVDQELIGFIKLLYIGVFADIVLIVTKQQHFERRPTNALIAKAVEICAQRGVAYLTYAKYAYGNKATSSLSEFKRRHGFEQVRFPRYYVPLTLKGTIATKLKLYRGIKEMLPEKIINSLLMARARLSKGIMSRPKSDREAKSPGTTG
jgi:hypothetical protein